jgi:TolB-like protein/Tfp pilus assembly protein PilF/DNA-binding XRE family transcriptional regulator
MARPNGRLIRELRQRKGLSVDQLARRAGVAEKTIWLIERDETDNPHPETIASLAGALGVQPEELFAPDSLPRGTTASPSGSKRWMAVAAGLVLLSGAAAVAIWGLWPPPPVDPIRSIAVLPLANLSVGPEQEYFADGMTEAMILDLSKVSALRVTSFTSTKRYRNSDKSVPEIAQELDVDGIIEGTVTRAGDRVRITVQLIDARDDRNIWADRYDRDLSDVLALQSEVALNVADQIRLELTPQEVARFEDRSIVDPEAHDVYLQGVVHLAKADLPGVLQAIEYFEQAVERDPEHALAYAGMARAYLHLDTVFDSLPSKEAMPKARAAAEKALALDESLGIAHSALGSVRWVYDWDWEQAEAELRRAVELSPNDPWALQAYGWYLIVLGRLDDGLSLMERAIQVAPLELYGRSTYVRSLYVARDSERAIEEVFKVLEIDSDFVTAVDDLAWAYHELGREEEAYRTWVRAHRLLGLDEKWRRGYERAYQRTGFEGALRYVLASKLEQMRTQYVDPLSIAGEYAALGEEDAAFEWLERAYQERNTSLVFLTGNPRFAPIRSDPRFDDLLRRINFPGAS